MCSEIVNEVQKIQGRNTHNAISNTSDGSANDELRHGFVTFDGSNLNGNTKNHDGSTNHHLILPSVTVYGIKLVRQ